ncbi:MAG: hypothetical protein O2927_04750 [Planctomycetota bacterium]|nr:hypothetical protein [Planctomycetota bacterium]
MARAPKLTNATLEALTAELERRRSSIPKLEAKAAALREQLAEVEAEIELLGGSTSKPRRGRPRKAARRGRPAGGTTRRRKTSKKATRKTSGRKTARKKVARKASGRGRRGGTLADSVAKVMGSKPMSPKEITAAIRAQKLRKDAKTLGTQVSQTLAKNKSMFKKQGRAQWVKVG